jgi:hypothetical protein
LLFFVKCTKSQEASRPKENQVRIPVPAFLGSFFVFLQSETRTPVCIYSTKAEITTSLCHGDRLYMAKLPCNKEEGV